VRSFLNARGLLLIYATFDIVRTWLWVRELADASLAEGFTIESPLTLMKDSILLLVAAIALKTRTRLGVLASFACACLLLYRGVKEFVGIARVEELSPWSFSSLRAWWSIGRGIWDFARLFLAALIVLSVLVTTLRRLAERRSHA
jgi:hypothetical protein